MNIGINSSATVVLDGELDNSLRVNSIYGILADKLNVMRSKKICRRIKDFMDINCILENMQFDLSELISVYKNIYTLDNTNVEEVYFLNPKNLDDIGHAYKMYNTASYKKPDFMKTYEFVLEFCSMFYSRLYINGKEKLIWKEGKFIECS